MISDRADLSSGGRRWKRYAAGAREAVDIKQRASDGREELLVVRENHSTRCIHEGVPKSR